MKTAGGSWIDMTGLGQTAFTWGDLVWPELKSTGLTDWVNGTDDSTERSSGSNSIEIGRQCSQQFHRSRLALSDTVMHLNPANTNVAVTACLFLLSDMSMMPVLWRRRRQRSATTNCRYVRSTSQFLVEHSHSERCQVRTMAATHSSCGFLQSLHTNADSVNVLNTTMTISWRLCTYTASRNFTYVLIFVCFAYFT